MPDLGIVVVPHPVAGISREELRKRAEGVIHDVVAILTGPSKEVREEEEGTAPKLIQISGNDYAEVYENFNRLFMEKRWGDGLPRVPPTQEKVDWMLTGTDLNPDEVIVQARPSGRAVTVRAVAVNAVMAGAIPPYMPVIIAALQAFNEVPWGWGSVTTTATAAPMIMINGPIAKQLDINSKSNALGHGWRANATIGRTIQAIFHTVGGAIPGITDMKQLGDPHTFTCRTFAENEDVLQALRWPTYAEDRGFSKEANTVSVTVIGAGYQIIMHFEAKTAEGLMEMFVGNIRPWNNAPHISPDGKMIPPTIIFLLVPDSAKLFADAGWTKQDIKNSFADRAAAKWTMPYKDWFKFMDMAYAKFNSEATPKWIKALPNDHPLSVPVDPDHIHVLVVGGPGEEPQIYPNLGSNLVPFITKEIKLPGNWGKIVKDAKITPMPMPKLPW